MTMGMNKPHRPLAQRGYEPWTPRPITVAVILAAWIGIIILGVWYR